LVGGHCIGVDPYYLAQKAQEVGYHPEIILSGRRLNDGMGAYVAEEVVKLMVKKNVPVKNARCLVMGFTFKENCPDVRNTKVIDIIDELKNFNITPVVYDPWASPLEVSHEYGFEIVNELPLGKFESIILAVAHNEFKEIQIKELLIENGVLFDVKGVLPKNLVDARL
jgi:UDP-N-acetyl-D-galactosamine dehydrogenase